MHFHLYGEETALISGAFGIREPDSENVLVPGGETLVVMPGAVFSEKRDRIGYGGGYYDRYLARTRAVKAVICRERVMRADIPVEPHDQLMDMVISEHGVRRLGSR